MLSVRYKPVHIRQTNGSPQQAVSNERQFMEAGRCEHVSYPQQEGRGGREAEWWAERGAPRAAHAPGHPSSRVAPEPRRTRAVWRNRCACTRPAPEVHHRCRLVAVGPAHKYQLHAWSIGTRWCQQITQTYCGRYLSRPVVYSKLSTNSPQCRGLLGWNSGWHLSWAWPQPPRAVQHHSPVHHGKL